MNKNNPYGYKVGYRENGSRLFVRYFMTRTYLQALFTRRFYRKYPQRTRETNRPIIDPFWEIKPITKKEYLAGIWNENPFLYKNATARVTFFFTRGLLSIAINLRIAFSLPLNASLRRRLLRP